MNYVSEHLYLLASVCAGLCALFATFVIVEFVSYTSARYQALLAFELRACDLLRDKRRAFWQSYGLMGL